MRDFATLRQQLVDNQIRPSEVTDRDLVKAFLTIPREMFADRDEQPFAYSDRELRMSRDAPDRRLLDPVQLARLLQALAVGSDSRAMVVGCGTGYSAAIMGCVARSVVAVEENPHLAAVARDNLRAVAAVNVSVVANKLVDGYPAEAPYDAILMDGAVEFVPESLTAQLRPRGLLAVIERDERISRAMLYERVGESATKWPLFEAWATLLPGFERKREFVF